MTYTLTPSRQCVYLFVDDGDKTELKTVSKDFNANAIRAEPNIEVNVNTYDQDTTESGEKGAQVSCKIPSEALISL